MSIDLTHPQRLSALVRQIEIDYQNELRQIRLDFEQGMVEWRDDPDAQKFIEMMKYVRSKPVIPRPTQKLTQA